MRNTIQFADDQVLPTQRLAQALRGRQHLGHPTAQAIEDVDIPGFRLHPLKGAMRGRWSISVSGNWRLTFEFQDGNAYVLDYEDYH